MKGKKEKKQYHGGSSETMWKERLKKLKEGELNEYML